MTFILSALFGLVLTVGFVFTAYYIGYYGLHLLDKFEAWYEAYTLDKE